MTTSSSVGDSLAVRTTLPIMHSSKWCCLNVCAGVSQDANPLMGLHNVEKSRPPPQGHESGGSVKHGKNRTKDYQYF